VHDHDDLDAGGREANEPLVRVAQERRCLAPDDRVRVGIEGQDRRSSVPTASLPDELAEQVGVPAMEAVEDADDEEDATEGRSEAFDAGDDSRRSLRHPG
jgi:hypothetical protein